MNIRYAKAYVEVLEIISFFSDEDYSKIPKEKIEIQNKILPHHNLTYQLNLKMNVIKLLQY